MTSSENSKPDHEQQNAVEKNQDDANSLSAGVEKLPQQEMLIENQFDGLNIRLPQGADEYASAQQRSSDHGIGKGKNSDRLSSIEILASLALQSAINRQQKQSLQRATALLIVVIVPSAQWCEPVKASFRSSFGGSVRIAELKGRYDHSSDSWLSELSKSQNNFTFVCSDVRHLPSSAALAADITIEVPAPNSRLILQFVKSVGRGRLAEGQKVNADGLDFNDLVAIVRPGRSVAEICSSLSKAFEKRCNPPSAINAPDLEKAISFGAAREWGLSLTADIAAVRRGQISWEEVDRGCAIYGPPGTGKTLFARSLAKHCGLPIVISSMSDHFGNSAGDLGAVVKAQRAVFDQAKAIAPSILFLDELDALPSRDRLGDRNGDWWLPVITDFLLLLDSSIADRNGVIVIGATNYIDKIDPAILRPGRLERCVYLGLPDAAGIEAILRYHLRGELADVDLAPVTVNILGMSPAQIMDVVRSARRIARSEGCALNTGQLHKALSGGVQLSPKDTRRIAVHEAGHAIAAIHFGFGLISVSITSLGNIGGRCIIRLPFEPLKTEASIYKHVMYLLAGRAAEEIILGQPSSGAGGGEGSDLQRATNALLELQEIHGLGQKLCQYPEALNRQLRQTADNQKAINKKIKIIYKEIRDHLSKNVGAINLISEKLQDNKYITGDHIHEIIMAASKNHL